MDTIKSLIQLASSKDPTNHQLFHLYYNWEEKENALNCMFNDISEELLSSYENTIMILGYYISKTPSFIHFIPTQPNGTYRFYNRLKDVLEDLLNESLKIHEQLHQSS